jgi:hypothetical protein
MRHPPADCCCKTEGLYGNPSIPEFITARHPGVRRAKFSRTFTYVTHLISHDRRVPSPSPFCLPVGEVFLSA